MQGIAQSLHDAALDLVMDRTRVQRAADALDDAIAHHLDLSRTGSHFNAFYSPPSQALRETLVKIEISFADIGNSDGVEFSASERVDGSKFQRIAKRCSGRARSYEDLARATLDVRMAARRNRT